MSTHSICFCGGNKKNYPRIITKYCLKSHLKNVFCNFTGGFGGGMDFMDDNMVRDLSFTFMFFNFLYFFISL